MKTCELQSCQREEQCDDCWMIDHCKECSGCEFYDHPEKKETYIEAVLGGVLLVSVTSVLGLLMWLLQ